MQLVVVSDHLSPCLAESALTIGNFDGVHCGHAEIFRHLAERGARCGLPTVAVTFDPHPLSILAPDSAPPLITTFAQKAELIERAGVDCLAVIPFSLHFSRMTAEEFVRVILCGTFGMRHMIIGHDYAFGRNRQGNYDTLLKMGAEHGFVIEDLDPCGGSQGIYSSSLIRRLVAAGQMPEAADALGRFYTIAGQVVHGRDIGRSLGYPTANIDTPNELIPADGVYAVLVQVDGRVFKGACNIGNNPTFGGQKRTIEVFLLDCNEQLYDRQVVVGFVRRLRDVLKFPDSSVLVQAITRDVDCVRSELASIDSSMFRPVDGAAFREVS